MSQKSGFFNAIESQGSYDREYDATDFAEYFSSFIGNGVLGRLGDTTLKVTRTGNLLVTVTKGKASIDGYWFNLTEDQVITIPANTTANEQTIAICVTLDRSKRQIAITTKTNNTTPVDDGSKHELIIAVVSLPANSSQISSVTDTRSDETKCGFAIGAVQIEDYWQKIYPIGSIYISVNNVNPEQLFGGTWVRFGEGKTLFGIDSSSDFNESEKTGGSKTRTLATQNLPSHSHSIGKHTHSLGNHKHTIAQHFHNITQMIVNTSSSGNHQHRGFSVNDSGRGSQSRISSNVASGATGSNGYVTNETGAHTHSVTIPSKNTEYAGATETGAVTGNTGENAEYTTGNTGNGNAFSILPPYISVYMWKRTA